MLSGADTSAKKRNVGTLRRPTVTGLANAARSRDDAGRDIAAGQTAFQVESLGWNATRIAAPGRRVRTRRQFEVAPPAQPEVGKNRLKHREVSEAVDLILILREMEKTSGFVMRGGIGDEQHAGSKPWGMGVWLRSIPAPLATEWRRRARGRQ